MSEPPPTGGRLAVETLRAAGIETLFGLPGSHVNLLLKEAEPAGIRTIYVRHEENAVLMAEGWALATGQPGLAVVTAGPGLSNALPGMAEANAAGAPLVVIAGRTAIRLRGRGAVQDLEQLASVGPLTKWRAECLTASRIPEYTVEAIRQASWGSPGVAYLEIPEDVLADIPGEPVDDRAALHPPARCVPEAKAVAAAVQLLESAQSPLILAGSGAFFSGAAEELTAFVGKTGIPVATTSAARGLIDDDHPLALGSLVHGGAAIPSADVILLLGSRLNANLMYGGPPLFATDQQVIQVDISAEHLGGPRTADLALVGDVGATLSALSQAWDHPADRWLKWSSQALATAQASRELWEREADGPSAGLHPGWVAREAARVFEEAGGGTWVSDGGDSVIWGIAFSRAHRPGSNMLVGSAMGTLGVGLPFATAAALAHPEQPVCLFTGDGAFGFSAQEMHTVARHHLPVIVIVINNGVWRGAGHSSNGGGAAVGVDYSMLGRALGGRGEQVRDNHEFAPALRRALAAAKAGQPTVIDAVSDPKVVSSLMRSLDQLSLM